MTRSQGAAYAASSDTVAAMMDTNPSQAPQFYLALGRAITTWQKVEREACDVFVKVSTCRDEQVASAISYSHQDKLQNSRSGG
jgi:hypothetical protein